MCACESRIACSRPSLADAAVELRLGVQPVLAANPLPAVQQHGVPGHVGYEDRRAADLARSPSGMILKLLRRRLRVRAGTPGSWSARTGGAGSESTATGGSTAGISLEASASAVDAGAVASTGSTDVTGLATSAVSRSRQVVIETAGDLCDCRCEFQQEVVIGAGAPGGETVGGMPCGLADRPAERIKELAGIVGRQACRPAELVGELADAREVTGGVLLGLDA